MRVRNQSDDLLSHTGSANLGEDYIQGWRHGLHLHRSKICGRWGMSEEDTKSKVGALQSEHNADKNGTRVLTIQGGLHFFSRTPKPDRCPV